MRFTYAEAMTDFHHYAPLAQAADTTAAKDGETLTVTADPNTPAEATNGYQPLQALAPLLGRWLEQAAHA